MQKPPFAVHSSLGTKREPGAWCVSLPGGSETLIRDGDPAWASATRHMGSTSLLYTTGGHFLALADADNEDLPELVMSFLEWIHAESTSLAARLPMSWDHSTAMRIETAVFLLQRLGHGPWVELLEQQLKEDIAWAQEEDHVLLNNHGAFLLQALMYAWTHRADLPRVDLEWVPQFVRERLPLILDSVYGDDGWCGENSPLYDRVWMILFKQMLRECGPALSASGARPAVEDALERAETTSRYQIYNTGHYVPRGDTQRLQTGLSPVKGTNWSMRNGIWVYNDGELYLHAVAGRSNIAHKHVDETQLLLTYKGIDFFIDGGFHGYDYSDPRIPVLRSPAAHSVLDFSPTSFLPPWRAYSGGSHAVSGEISFASRNSVVLQKRVGDGVTLERAIGVEGEVVQIRDAWSTPVGGGTDVLIRFLLPDTCAVSVTGRLVILRRLGNELHMKFDRDVEVTPVHAEDYPPYRGWYSMRTGKLNRGTSLEIRPRHSSDVDSLCYTLTVQA